MTETKVNILDTDMFPQYCRSFKLKGPLRILTQIAVLEAIINDGFIKCKLIPLFSVGVYHIEYHSSRLYFLYEFKSIKK